MFLSVHLCYKSHCSLGQQIKGKVIGTSLGSVTYLSFHPGDSEVAACIDQMVYVLDTQVCQYATPQQCHDQITFECHSLSALSH